RVRVLSPQGEQLARLLTNEGATVQTNDGALSVTGLDAARVGDLAATHRITLHELTPQRASLEEAFFELTEDSVEYHGGDAKRPAAGAEPPNGPPPPPPSHTPSGRSSAPSAPPSGRWWRPSASRSRSAFCSASPTPDGSIGSDSVSG